MSIFSRVRRANDPVGKDKSLFQLIGVFPTWGPIEFLLLLELLLKFGHFRFLAHQIFRKNACNRTIIMHKHEWHIQKTKFHCLCRFRVFLSCAKKIIATYCPALLEGSWWNGNSVILLNIFLILNLYILRADVSFLNYIDSILNPDTSRYSQHQICGWIHLGQLMSFVKFKLPASNI